MRPDPPAWFAMLAADDFGGWLVMDPAWLTALVPLVLAAGGAVSWLISRRDKRKDPLPKQQAELAIAQQALGIVTEAAAFSAAEASGLRERVVKLEADREEDREAREVDRARISRLEGLFARAVSYIETLLRAWGSPKPPQPPAELHELIDPALWDAAP
jgi:hypothetical protein